MYVCICNALTDQQITQAAMAGAAAVPEAYQALGAEICCGQCRCMAQEIIDESRTVPMQAAE